jgi:hypothetical protein
VQLTELSSAHRIASCTFSLGFTNPFSPFTPILNALGDAVWFEEKNYAVMRVPDFIDETTWHPRPSVRDVVTCDARTELRTPPRGGDASRVADRAARNRTVHDHCIPRGCD